LRGKQPRLNAKDLKKKLSEKIVVYGMEKK